MRANRSSARTCSRSIGPRALLLATLATTLVSRRAAAQEDPKAECTATAVASMSAAQLRTDWADFAPDSLKKRFRPARERGAWTAVADTIAMLFALVPAPSTLAHPPASVPDTLKGLLVAQLAALRDELAAGEADPTRRLSGNADAARFRPRTGLGAPQLFIGRPGGPIDLTQVTRTEARSICWLALSLTDLAVLYGVPARAELVRALDKRAERWDNFMRHGYSMTPWELFLNGYAPRRATEPPRVQGILLHPSAGEEMYTQGKLAWRNLRRREVLTLEPIGFVNYSPSFAWYWGASYVVSYPDSGGIAQGVMLHVKNVGHAGYLWRPRDPDGRGHSLMLSLDLYRLIAGVPKQLEKYRKEALASCLADVAGCIKGS